MTPSNPAPVGDERAKFEAWYVVGNPNQAFLRRTDGKYVSPFAEECWQAWQAAGSTVQQVGADALDAARYRRLKEWFASANFFPEEMDLDPGVALIFVAPVGLKVSADLDAPIDGAPKSEQGDQQ